MTLKSLLSCLRNVGNLGNYWLTTKQLVGQSEGKMVSFWKIQKCMW